MYRPAREETTDATSTAVATTSLSAALTARAAFPRTRPSSASTSAIWLRLLPSAIFRRLPFTRNTPFLSSMLSFTTASRAPSTLALSASARLSTAATVLLPRVSASPRRPKWFISVSLRSLRLLLR